MREIGISESNSDVRLRRALRSLSAASPGEASQQIGDSLAGAFRRHHARRRARLRAIVSTVLAVALAGAVLVVKENRDGPAVAKVPAKMTISPAASQVPEASSAVAKQPSVKRHRLVSVAKGPASPVRSEFVALPTSDQPPGEEELRVIRLELSGSMLRLFGAPVTEEIADRRVLADFVVGEDGTPYAVRLVR